MWMAYITKNWLEAVSREVFRSCGRYELDRRNIVNEERKVTVTLVIAIRPVG